MAAGLRSFSSTTLAADKKSASHDFVCLRCAWHRSQRGASAGTVGVSEALIEKGLALAKPFVHKKRIKYGYSISVIVF